MRDRVAEGIISLCTSRNRAVAITGDLAEDMDQRGSLRFWLEVIRVAFALWRSATMRAPGRVCLLTLLGAALLAAPALAGLAAINLFPAAMDSTLPWIGFVLFCWGGAFWTGASLVALAPRHGTMACVSLALAVQVPAIVFGQSVIASAFALAGAALLTAGGILARERLRMVPAPTAELPQ